MAQGVTLGLVSGTVAQIALRVTDLEPVRCPRLLLCGCTWDNGWHHRGGTYAPRVTRLLCLNLSFSICRLAIN